MPLVLAAIAVAGVVLGALYMLRFALGFLFGAAQAPNQPIADLGGREKAILGAIVVAVFALGLFPDEPMRRPSWRRSRIASSSRRRAPSRRGSTP